MEVLQFFFYCVFSFGLGLLGIATLYWTVRYSRRIWQVIFFGLCGTALLAAQCLLIKFLSDMGRAFGGDDTSGVVMICILFSVMAVAAFLVAALHKFSNGNQ